MSCAVVVSGELATDVGFAMSVLATAGVVAGSALRPRAFPRPIGTLVGATCGAQLAVAPVALTVFGSVPLLAPLTNLAAIPIVSAATALGAVGIATGLDPLVDLAAVGAAAVLAIARVAAAWPQVGWTGLIGAVAAVACLRSRWRPGGPGHRGIVAWSVVPTSGLRKRRRRGAR